MKKIKMFHEAPLSMFDKVQEATDGDYFLVHLFETNPEYKEKALQAREKGREIILDNSIFELGKAFNMKDFAWEVMTIKPDYYIVPDVLEDAKGTIDNLIDWVTKYKNDVDHITNNGAKMMAVVQGKTLEEIEVCYKVLDALGVDKICFSFDLSLYEKLFPEEPNQLKAWAKGRAMVIKYLIAGNVINRSKPHHLLGCSCAGEGQFYCDDSMFDFIDSIDTSSPVIRGIFGMDYSVPFWGNTEKPSTKLYTIIDGHYGDKVEKDVLDNIESFRTFWEKKGN